MTAMPAPVPPVPWWRDAVCYEIHPRAFADSNGDGIGDLPGATARLDHLARLGVDAVWITPFYPSPLADGGYDIADHTGVAADLGTPADFDALVAKAHALDIKVLVDVVPNHTSHQHPWFREALAAEPGSPARGRYLFREGRGEKGELPPNDWQSAFGGPAWTRIDETDGRPGQWYLHLHAPEQPDLNWRNAEVVTEFERILEHWLDRGVDGFRVDVAHTLFKAEDLPDAGPGQHQDVHRNHLMPYYDQDELHPLFRTWRELLDRHPAPAGAVAPYERVMVAEAGIFDRERLARYVAPGEMQQIFNFAFLECPWDGPAMREVVEQSARAMRTVGAPVTWVLSSHDAIRPVTRYGSGPLGSRRARAAALLMLALPGAAYVYQGEELGLPQAHIPSGSAPNTAIGDATAAGYRFPGRVASLRTASATPPPRPAGSRNPPTGADSPSRHSRRTSTPCSPCTGPHCACVASARPETPWCGSKVPLTASGSPSTGRPGCDA
jgi:alpha-glucosidase